MGVSGNDQGMAVALDGSGNCYITGYYYATADFDPGSGTQLLRPLGIVIFFWRNMMAQAIIYGPEISGPSIDVVADIAVDASGNYFTGTSDFDPEAGTQNLTGNQDIFMAKYDASGNYVWAWGTGLFLYTADFDPDAAKSNLISVNSYDIFVANYGPGIPLPVKLESFSGRLVDKGGAVLLQWTSAAEENHAYFSVERNSGNNNFTTVGRIIGCGTCSLRQQYSFTDHQPLAGKSYYRLKMVNKDGLAEYSKWIFCIIYDRFYRSKYAC